MRTVQAVDYDLSTGAKNFDAIQVHNGGTFLLSIEASSSITATFKMQMSDDEGANFVDMLDSSGSTIEIAISADTAGMQLISGVVQGQWLRVITEAAGIGTVNNIKWIDV